MVPSNKRILLKKNKNKYLPTYDSIEAPESDYLYIDTSTIPNSGNGLYTAIDIFKDEIISFFEGEILTDIEAENRASKGEDGYFVSMLSGQILDSMHIHCFAKYANDSKGVVASPSKHNSCITIDETGHVCLVATRTIAAGSEIFCSYGRRYWSNFKKKAILSLSN